VLAWAIAVLLAVAALLGLACYPLPPWPLATALAVYGALLWHRPAAFLIVLPVVLPALDLGIWTGWTMIGESDFFIAITIAVLLIRDPPARSDLRHPLRTTPIVTIVLAILTGCWLIAMLIGVATSFGAPRSDNALLRPDNALRLGKGLFEALALLPFLSRRHHRRHDTAIRLGWGLTAGLCAVTLIVLAERLLFTGICDTGTAYRVAGPFSSMHVGGGHIGAYAALVLPFTLSMLSVRPRWCGLLATALATLAGGYTLAVTFARTAYAAALVAMTVTACIRVSHRPYSGLARKALILPALLTLLSLAAVTASGGMQARFADSANDLQTRWDNWRAGLAVRDTGTFTTLFGMGLGTYQRVMFTRSPINRPSDLALNRDGQGAYVSLYIETPFFLGQKITLPDHVPLHLTLLARPASGPTRLDVLLCDKLLLYSDNCHAANLPLPESHRWNRLQTPIDTTNLGATALFGLLRRPVELSLSAPPGHAIDIRDISLTDNAEHPLLANGDFTRGLDHWIFTDDSHVAWRMLNQYLMLFFETGLVGLAAFIALAILALTGAARAARGGCAASAPVAGAIAGFLVSGLSDNLLEAPRLATLFFLVCCCGLIQRTATPEQTPARNKTV
jgi:hypothetical protein